MRWDETYASDPSANRVLMWNSIPAANQAAASIVLGQPSFVASASGATASTMNYPEGIFTDGTRLFVADADNSRVLIWNAIPTPFEPANLVVGQPNMTTALSGLNASTLSYPESVLYDGTKLYISDAGNNRVLVWSTLPTANGMPANAVLGQPDMTTNNSGGLTANSLGGARGLATDGTRIFVGDADRRILILPMP